MFFGKPVDIKVKLKANETEIDWVSQWTYLGVDLKSGPQFGCSVADRVKKYYRGVNGILRKI